MVYRFYKIKTFLTITDTVNKWKAEKKQLVFTNGCFDILHLGHIAEMRTGEGKTLVATLPAYLNALTGRGVHVVTVNDRIIFVQFLYLVHAIKFLTILLCLLDLAMLQVVVLRL